MCEISNSSVHEVQRFQIWNFLDKPYWNDRTFSFFIFCSFYRMIANFSNSLANYMQVAQAPSKAQAQYCLPNFIDLSNIGMI